MADFHPFTRLPMEIQDEIWRLCLPHRICESDRSLDHALTSGDEPKYFKVQTCDLQHTSRINANPPAIAYVCRASRKLAFQAGGYCVDPCIERSDDATPAPAERGMWLDPARDISHMDWNNIESHWCSILDIGHPVRYLAWESKMMVQTLRLSYLRPSRLARIGIPLEIPNGPSIQPHYTLASSGVMGSTKGDCCWYKDCPDFQLPDWQVVTRIVVIHCDWKTAAATGLFGFLGDAWIQIVDKTEGSRLDDFWRLEKESRSEELRQCGCNGPRQASMFEEFHFRHYALTMPVLWTEEMAAALRPAIMFRLCTKKCTHAEEYHRRSREETDKRIAQRGAFRGRGRGRS